MGGDPGLRITGWGVIEVNSNKLSGIACWIIKTNKNDSISFRLNLI